jgi:hypothetical protein
MESKLYTPIIIILLTLIITIYVAIIPTELTEENIPLLQAILAINLFISIAIFFLLRSTLKDTIIGLSLFCTFLIAVPITVYNLGVTSLIYSNT